MKALLTSILFLVSLVLYSQDVDTIDSEVRLQIKVIEVTKNSNIALELDLVIIAADSFCLFNEFGFSEEMTKKFNFDRTLIISKNQVSECSYLSNTKNKMIIIKIKNYKLNEHKKREVIDLLFNIKLWINDELILNKVVKDSLEYIEIF